MLAQEIYGAVVWPLSAELNWVHPRDRVRLAKLSWLLLSNSEASIAEQLLGAAAHSQLARDFAHYCALDHMALLVFPSRVEAATELLQSLGYRTSETTPSVVVRQRLAERYQIPIEQMDVQIARGAARSVDGVDREVELFVWSSPPWAIAAYADEERSLENEAHIGFRLISPDSSTLEQLRTGLAHEAGFDPEGGGFNPHENPKLGGTTVFYFRQRDDVGGLKVMRRLELKCVGDYSSLLDLHR